MNMMTTIVAPPDRATVLNILRRFGRVDLEQAIEEMIALLDAQDGDLEAEPATWQEGASRGAEKGLTDDHEANGDEEDTAFAEWLSRGRHKLYAGEVEGVTRDRQGWAFHEDSEDDDAGEHDDEDTGAEEAGELTSFEQWQGMNAASWHDDDEDDDPGERARQPLTLNLIAGNDR